MQAESDWNALHTTSRRAPAMHLHFRYIVHLSHMLLYLEHHESLLVQLGSVTGLIIAALILKSQLSDQEGPSLIDARGAP